MPATLRARTLLFTVFAIAFLRTPTARSEVVFSTLSGTYSSNLPIGALGADWTLGGQQFNSGGNTLITGVTLNLGSFGGNNGTFNVQIWTDASDSPGTLAGSIASNQPQGSISGFQNFVYTGSVAVSPNTNYWVVMDATNMNGQVVWGYTNDDPSLNPGFVNVVGSSLLKSSDLPASWATPAGITSGRLKMEVVAVPEPPAIVMAGIGIASAIWSVQRRRKPAS